jgi:hypothetical protein
MARSTSRRHDDVVDAGDSIRRRKARGARSDFVAAYFVRRMPPLLDLLGGEEMHLAENEGVSKDLGAWCS